MIDTFDHTIYSEPAVRCPLCGSDQLVMHAFITRYTNPFRVDRCRACRFLFMNPRFNDSIMTAMYSEAYYTGNAEYAYYDERDATRFAAYVWKKRIARIRSYVMGGNFLDVGSAFGGLLDVAGEFYTPYGIELSPYGAAHARKQYGNAVHQGTLVDHPFPDSFFSAITMIEVLEHIPDPVHAIGECYRLLREDGVLVLQTANMDGLQAVMQGRSYAYYMPGHCSYFSAATLKKLLARTGFRTIKVYYPVEFGLLPKLMKSRYTFTSWTDYRRWFRIAAYHVLGTIHCGRFALMSSMVVYAVK